MVKITHRKSLGTQAVYDIGVEQDHNFVLANGSVASNCFNKSHSTAYAYLTYQTAYLKANYPVEYMAALLTASSSNTDKVEKYIDTCQKMNIDVEPPDINRSEENFTPAGEKIVFGLSAVRNVGQGAIENILHARQEAGGKFQALADLCARVDLHLVNRRALESLIYCGAFDCMESNRKQLIHDLDLILSWAQSRARDRDSGQISIFDAMSSSSSQGSDRGTGFEHAPKAKPVEDFSSSEKLKQEKELLGFYVSEHPLKSAQQAATVLSPISLSDLSQQRLKANVSAIVILSAAKTILTKNGDRMAFVQMEDLSGQTEGVVFPKTYEQIGSFLEEDARLIVWGKVEQRDDKLQLIVEDAEPIEKVRMVMVELTPQQAANSSEQQRLQGILQDQSGDKNRAKVPVVGMISTGERRQFVRFGSKFWVQDYRAAVEHLNATGFQANATTLVGIRD